MKYTLLEVVQSYLSATSGFKVDDIDDTVESEEVTDIARDVYNELIDDIPDWQFRTQVMQLEGLGDTSRPNYMKIPDNVVSILDSLIYYNKVQSTSSYTLRYDKIDYVSNQEFLAQVNGVQDNVANTTTVTDDSGVQFNIFTNRSPIICTSFDGELLVFDSYDSAVDTTLQASKSQVVGATTSTFTRENTWEIDLPENMQVTYLHMVKSAASQYLRQEDLPRDSRKARAGIIKNRLKQKRIGSKAQRAKSYGRKNRRV